MRAFALFLVACGGADADFDGISAGDDCDDADPFVYPGAPEAPGDGVDADCDGIDPPIPIVGSWEVTSFDADYSGFALFTPGTASGVLTVDEDFAAAVEVAAKLELYDGFELQFVLDGGVSTIPGEEVYALYAEAELYGELVHVAWDCEVLEADVLTCGGELKALDTSWNSVAVFARAE